MLKTAVLCSAIVRQIPRENLNIYQASINEDDMIFIRHYGKFKGAKSFNALLATLAPDPGSAQLKSVCFVRKRINICANCRKVRRDGNESL
jgi:hypothetical protein